MLLIVERDSARVRVVGTSDIAPGVFPNVVHAGSGAPIRVAIESNPQFDASDLARGLAAGAREALIAGRLTDGRPFRDADWVSVRP